MSRFATLTGAALVSLATMMLAPASSSAQESRLDMVIKRDKLIVGTFNSAPPLCYVDDKGELTGFEIDLAKLIAKYLLGDANKVEFVTFTAEGRWPAVLSGKVDFGIASTTVYPDRAARVAFTQPYMDSGIVLLTRKDVNVNSLAELNNEKFTLASLNNPQMQDRHKRYMPKMQNLIFDTPSAMFLAVKTGRAAAMQMDIPVANWYAAQNDELKVLPDVLGNIQNNAIFMKPGDFTWWLYLDTVVQELRYGSRYDDYTELYKKWFKQDPPPQRFYVGGRKAN
jgi:polar amino acid transport system substrate-binding protein